MPLGSPPRMRGKRPSTPCTDQPCGITPADAGKTIQSVCAGLWYKDHPRGCGENPLWQARGTATMGSPPRMRGKLHAITILQCCARITPADAGKTERENPLLGGHRDHPRGCGENEEGFCAAVADRGSPPRMRGKPAKTARKRSTYGITPADAGKTNGLI